MNLGAQTPGQFPPHESASLEGLSFKRLFSSVAKYTFLAVFVLYAVGFLIWSAFLAQFSISPRNLVQLDYFAAALCFLIIFFVLAAPVGLTSLASSSKEESEWLKTFVSPMFFLWYLVLIRMKALFFPTQNFSYEWPLICLLILLGNFLCERLVKTRPQNQLLKILAHPAMGWGSLTLVVLIEICVQHPSFTGFILISVLFASTIEGTFGGKVEKFIGTKTPAKLRILAFALVLLLVMEHIRSFGSSVFGSIPRDLGGGMPHLATLKLANRVEVLRELGVPETNGLWGPVAIVFQDDKNLVVAKERRAPNAKQPLAVSLRTDQIEAVILHKRPTSTP